MKRSEKSAQFYPLAIGQWLAVEQTQSRSKSGRSVFWQDHYKAVITDLKRNGNDVIAFVVRADTGLADQLVFYVSFQGKLRLERDGLCAKIVGEPPAQHDMFAERAV